VLRFFEGVLPFCIQRIKAALHHRHRHGLPLRLRLPPMTPCTAQRPTRPTAIGEPDRSASEVPERGNGTSASRHKAVLD
jgi:hypothetical protein